MIVHKTALLLLLCAALYADSPASVKSKKAIYEGNALILKGCVQLDHKLGTIESGTARLEKESADAPISAISLTDNVKIVLQNQSEILCDKADFDFNNLCATLYPKQGEAILFSTTQHHPVTLSSQQAQVTLAKDAHSIWIKSIEAKEHVLAHYGNEFTLSTETLVYAQDPTSHISVPSHAILNHGGDQVEAAQMEVFPEISKAHLVSPKGRLQPLSLAAEQGDLQFSCDQLTWDDLRHILTLQGNIAIEDGQFVRLHCDEEVELTQKQSEGKWVFHELVASGKTDVQCHFSSSFAPLLVCHGLVRVDHDHQLITLESLSEIPIQFFHQQLKLSGDRGHIEYLQAGGKVIPHQFLLTGNILLTSSKPSDATMFGIADQCTYLAETETIVLSCQNGNRVLFRDEAQDLSMSAHEVHISKTEESFAVKGIGNVRFTFSSQEHALLQKLFPFYQSTGGSGGSSN